MWYEIVKRLGTPDLENINANNQLVYKRCFINNFQGVCVTCCMHASDCVKF